MGAVAWIFFYMLCIFFVIFLIAILIGGLEIKKQEELEAKKQKEIEENLRKQKELEDKKQRELKELEDKKQKEKEEFKEYIKSIMLEVNTESVTPIDEMFKKWKKSKEKA